MKIIKAKFPGAIMKRKGTPFKPAYALEDHGTYNKLYRLYCLPGGGLEVILGRPARNADPFWPTKHGRRYANQIEFSNWIKDLVREHAHVLQAGVTYASLRAAGVLRTKFCRHAVATRLVREGQKWLAVFLLHHASEQMVTKIYAKDDEESYDAHAEAARAAEIGTALEVELAAREASLAAREAAVARREQEVLSLRRIA